MGRIHHFLKKVIFVICFLCVVTLIVKSYYAHTDIESLAIDGKKSRRDKYFELQDEMEADSKAETADFNDGSNPIELLNVSVGDDREKKIDEMKNGYSSDFLQNENLKSPDGVQVFDLNKNGIASDLGSREEDNLLFVRAMGSKNFKKHDQNDFEENVDNNYVNAPVDANYGQINQEIDVNLARQNQNVSSSPINNSSAFVSFPADYQQNASNEIIRKEDEYLSVPVLVGSNEITSHPVDKTSPSLVNTSPSPVRRTSKHSLHNRQQSRATTTSVIQDANNNFFDPFAIDSFGKVERVPDYELPILKNNLLVNKSSMPTGILSEIQTKSHHNYSSKVGLADSVKQIVLTDSTKQERTEAIEKSKPPSVRNEIYKDQPMSGVVIIGKPNNTRRYAVFSTTSDNRESVNFVFLVPLTALAWKRAGFDSIVIVVGSADEWKADPFYNFVLMSAQKLDAVFIFLEPRPEKSIMISQVARLFAGNILRTVFTEMDDVYLVTSDADIWPMYGHAYLLPQGADILSLNSDCCAPFKHRGKTYRMLPMANVGMKIRTWRSMTTKFGEVPNSIDDILTLFVREFGNVALRSVRKGENIGWFLDQMMVSLLISDWGATNNRTRVRYVPRQTGIDRIDRNSWDLGSTIEDKIDSHLPFDTYIPGVWVRLNGLIRAMYGNGSRRYHWCIDYYEQFQDLFISKFRHGG